MKKSKFETLINDIRLASQELNGKDIVFDFDAITKDNSTEKLDSIQTNKLFQELQMVFEGSFPYQSAINRTTLNSLTVKYHFNETPDLTTFISEGGAKTLLLNGKITKLCLDFGNTSAEKVFTLNTIEKLKHALNDEGLPIIGSSMSVSFEKNKQFSIKHYL